MPFVLTHPFDGKCEIVRLRGWKAPIKGVFGYKKVSFATRI